MRASLIVAAAGRGVRFRESLTKETQSRRRPSKLFFPLLGKPVFLHAVSAFRPFPQIHETLLAVPAGARESAQRWLKKYDPASGIRVIAGGKTRAESVWKALRKADSKSAWVMVHDGARPLVPREAVDRLFASTGDADGAILAKKVVPTIKETRSGGFVARTLDRTFLFEAETPQLVRRSVLEKAYRTHPQAFDATDEASLLESLNARVKIVPHNGWNPKITTAEDLELVEAYLERKIPREVRTGLGRDTHRLVEGRKLILGGVEIPFGKGPLGHSDGDVLLHAVTDAILGVLGAGDIGDWFSDRDPKNKNIPSSKMLSAVCKEAGSRGWSPLHVDAVLLLEKPRLGASKKKIAAHLAKLLGLTGDRVSVKAKTAEGLGPEGEGRAITCEAIVTMQQHGDR